jgi:hypothetical protein
VDNIWRVALLRHWSVNRHFILFYEVKFTEEFVFLFLLILPFSSEELFSPSIASHEPPSIASFHEPRVSISIRLAERTERLFLCRPEIWNQNHAHHPTRIGSESNRMSSESIFKTMRNWKTLWLLFGQVMGFMQGESEQSHHQRRLIEIAAEHGKGSSKNGVSRKIYQLATCSLLLPKGTNGHGKARIRRSSTEPLKLQLIKLRTLREERFGKFLRVLVSFSIQIRVVPCTPLLIAK